MTDKPVLAIGDVQGHFDRLEALLLQEGIIGPCGVCGGSGDVSESDDGDFEFCPTCKGVGTARVNHDVVVLQLGDLIDATYSTLTTDSLCIHFGDLWLDYVLWGNHDRPVIDYNRMLCFGGYTPPMPDVVEAVKRLHNEGRYRLAYEAHGFLFVHAGLPLEAAYEDLKLKPGDVGFADYLDALDREMLGRTEYRMSGVTYDGAVDAEARAFLALRDSISYYRGGPHRYGGLLWRDQAEPLCRVPQVFAHSSAPTVRRFDESYCLDLSKHGKIGALWLPDERIVEC